MATALFLFTALCLATSPIVLVVPDHAKLDVVALFAGCMAFQSAGMLLARQGRTDAAAAVAGCGISAVIAWSTVSMNLVTEAVWFLAIGLLVASFASSPRVVGVVYLLDVALLGVIHARVPVLAYAGDKVPLLPMVLSFLTAVALSAALNAALANRGLQRLIEANHRVEQASRAKDLFMANMSHELRTPLNAIIGYSELLVEDLGTSLPDEAFRDLQRIRRSGQHLLAMVDGVLDLARIEADRLELGLGSVDVEGLTDEVADTAAPLVGVNHNVLGRSIAPELGVVITDRTRLQQVLLNLLTNAAKFTRDGRIDLAVAARDGGVTWTVRDTGIGMAPPVLARIFEPFFQGDASPTREQDGAGLGLALSQRLVRRLGGQITVESAVGQGTTFELWLPRVHPEA